MKTLSLLGLLLSTSLLASAPPTTKVETYAQVNGTVLVRLHGAAAETLYASLTGVPDTANAGFEAHYSTSRNGENISCLKATSGDFVVTPTSKPMTTSYSCTIFVDAKGRVTAN